MTFAIDRSNWNRVKFGDVITSVSERVDDPSSAGVDRYVGLEHLDPGSMTVTRWGTPDQVEAQKLRFQADDVIFGRRRAYQKKVARADFEGICSAHALVLRAKPGLMAPDFLPVFLSSEVFLDRAVKISVGSLSPTVNWKTLAAQEFILPPRAEQQRIADLLWGVEHATRSARLVRESLATVAELRADELLAWDASTKMLPCRELCTTITVGVVVRPTQYYAATGVPALRSLNVTRNGFVLDDLVYFDEKSHESLPKTTLRLGDVVVVRTGRPGEAAVVDASTAGNNAIDIIIARPGKDLAPEYLARFLNSRVGRAATLRTSAGTAQQHFNVGALSQLMIPARSPQEQQRIVEELKQLDEAVASVDAEVAAAVTLREATSQMVWESA